MCPFNAVRSLVCSISMHLGLKIRDFESIPWNVQLFPSKFETNERAVCTKRDHFYKTIYLFNHSTDWNDGSTVKNIIIMMPHITIHSTISFQKHQDQSVKPFKNYDILKGKFYENDPFFVWYLSIALCSLAWKLSCIFQNHNWTFRLSHTIRSSGKFFNHLI